MAIFSFSLSEVKNLAEELAAADAYSPTMEDLFDASLYAGGILRNRDGRSEAEVEKEGGVFWPSSKHINTDKVRPQLILVGDQGVYLMTNAKMDGTPASRSTVAYADRCNPEKDENWYENKLAMFGGDDGSVSMPAQWVEIAKETGGEKFQLNLTSDSIAVVPNVPK